MDIIQLPDSFTDEELKEAWIDQLKTAEDRISHILGGYISDDGLDYLHSALDLATQLSWDYIDGLGQSQFLIGLAKPLEDQKWAQEGEVLRELDNYACDGVSEVLRTLVEKIGRAVY